ncbi:MAG TPA: hypothetical protein VE667_07400 [Xanthobacteraceae bacterium]|nr:hypothetical protein [Xanthobacteraceae bacterium]
MTLELIGLTRGEISRLRENIKLARRTVDRSQKLLSRVESSQHPTASPAKPL